MERREYLVLACLKSKLEYNHLGVDHTFGWKRAQLDDLLRNWISLREQTPSSIFYFFLRGGVGAIIFMLLFEFTTPSALPFKCLEESVTGTASYSHIYLFESWDVLKELSELLL